MFRRGLSRSKAGERRNNEPEYEEVGPPMHLRKATESRGDGVHCELCGSMVAAVRCDKCGGQAFCLSCDDMYHRHPRRSQHVRKAVDAKSTSGGGVRPPLPPKGEVPPPQPPPRKNKRSGFLSNAAFRKDQAYGRPGTVANRSTSMTNLQSASSDGGRTIMGSLKRFMGARPLPPTPDPGKAVVSSCEGEVNGRPSGNRPISARAVTSPSLPNLNNHIEDETNSGLPQSVTELNALTTLPRNTSSTPATPSSTHAQYPRLQPKTLPPQPPPQQQPQKQQPPTQTHSLGRKFSLQHLPQNFEDKRTSMVEATPGGVAWEGEGAKASPRNRSHSISDDQWAQVMAAQPNHRSSALPPEAQQGPACPPGHTPADMSAFTGITPRRSYAGMSSGRGGAGALGRGMVSSASVCDLNALSSQHHHQHQHQHQQQQQPQDFTASHGANSFQQLNLMGCGGGVMWGAPCELCQAAAGYPGHAGAGMKRTASNLSMNLSSVGSDVTGYPWAAPMPHVHHHMPMYPGYYPGYHPHMMMPSMGAPMGLNMSIPDSMHTFSKMPSSPAPSVRSSSHRSHKSSKSRSFSAPDNSGRRSRNLKARRSGESEESRSSSVSDEVDDDDRGSKSGMSSGGNLAWQCDHCTFINNAGTRTCGMCSKSAVSSGRTSRRGSERRRSERRRDKQANREEDEGNLSDYDNEDGGVVKSNLSFSIKDNRRDNRSKTSGSNKSKKKSRRRGSSASDSASGSNGEDEERLERHMRDLRVSSGRGNDYEGVSKDKDKDRDRTSRKKEGSVSRFKNRGRHPSERSRTPGRQTPRLPSPAPHRRSSEDSFYSSSSDSDPQRHHTNHSGDHEHSLNSADRTLVGTLVSEATLKTDKKSKSNNSEPKHKSRRSKPSSPVRSIGKEAAAHLDTDRDVLNEINDNKDKSPSPKLNIRRSQSPVVSRRTSREGDEPSFANTLDDVPTLGTNEVADQDLGSQHTDDHPHLNDALAESEIKPNFQPNEPSSPDTHLIQESSNAVPEAPSVPQHGSEESHIKETINFGEHKAKVSIKTSDKTLTVANSECEPSYETVEDPTKAVNQVEKSREMVEPSLEPDQDYQTIQTIRKEPLVAGKDLAGHVELSGEDVQQIASKTPWNPYHEMREVARSASSGSSLGPNNSPHERQYTPVSFSSSDAQFYSPPDSPDLSLSEQLQENLQHSGQKQATRSFKLSEEEVGEKFLTVEEIITRRRQEAMRKQGLKLVQVLRDAEEMGYQSEDVSIALTHCGDKNPLEWLKENWRHMVDTVATLATNYGQERQVNDIGIITATEAKMALRHHKGNIWAAVTECVEQRQKKFSEIYARGRFRREDVVRVLETNHGDADAAFLELNKSQLQPFLMKIWNPLQATMKKSPPPPTQPVASLRSPSSPPLTDSSLQPLSLETPQSDTQESPTQIASEVSNQAPKGWLEGRMTPTFDTSATKVPGRLWQGLCSLFDSTTKRSASESRGEQEEEEEEEDLEEEEDDDDDNDDESEEEEEEQEGEEEGMVENKEEEIKKTVMTRLQNIEFVDTSDDDDVFENTYATIDPIRKPPKMEPIYATVKKKPKKIQKVEDVGNEALVQQAEMSVKPAEEERLNADYLSSARVDLPTQEDDQLFSAVEIVASDDDSTMEESLMELESGAPYYEYFSAIDVDATDESGNLTDIDDSDHMSQGDEDQQDKQIPLLEGIHEHKDDVHEGDEGKEEDDDDDAKLNIQREPPATLQYMRIEEYENDESATGEVQIPEMQHSEVHLQTETCRDEENKTEEESDDAEIEMVEDEEQQGDQEREDMQLPVIEPGMLQTRTGPVTVQKASVIVGKAIAKAMARESSVREAHSGSETPELQEPQEAPMATPESSEDEAEVLQVSGSDSSDEDQMHLLDTIPEEEEISEMTESGRAKPPVKRITAEDNVNETSATVPSSQRPPPPISSLTPSPAAVVSETPATPTPSQASSLATPEPEPDVAQLSSVPEVNEVNEAVAISKDSETRKESQKPNELVSTVKKKDVSEQKPGEKENTVGKKLKESTDQTSKEASLNNSKKVTSASTSTATTAKENTSTKEPEVAGKTVVKRRRRVVDEAGEGVTSTTTNASASASTTASAKSSNNTPRRRRRNKSLPESSGESEGEEGMVRADRIEGLKARPNKKEPDYQEMRELKEQIQIMRRELESKIEDTDDRPDTPESPLDEHPPSKTPLVLLPDIQPQEKPPPKEYEQLKFDRTVRRLLAEGRSGTYEKAELAAHLLNFNFTEADSVQAAEECSSIYTAIQFLQQECELCAEKYPMRKMVSLLQCTHRCCCDCAKTYFTFQIKTKNIREVRCPFCNEPDLDANEEIANEYLNNMDILLKNILDPDAHELFQRKLRDWTLMKDPNFRWCNKCSSGFIANPRARKLICPDCKDVTCAQCRAPWESTHEGISCEAFALWKSDNDEETAIQGVARHLAECGITCPSCKFTYSLAKGGCMHFTCTQCKYEFCSGCGQPFRQGAKCPVGPYCERLGLHAHHPRNCLFYLRDKEPQQLQNLLKEAGVTYDTEPPAGQQEQIKAGRTSCQVQEQKELPDGLKDDICGRIVPSGYAGLCRLHYTEYLVEKINAHKLDPVSIFDEADLRVCLRRNGKTVPVRRWESEKLYRDKLIKLIKEHLPLESLD